jgi:hypothetical protein
MNGNSKKQPGRENSKEERRLFAMSSLFSRQLFLLRRLPFSPLLFSRDSRNSRLSFLGIARGGLKIC